MQAGLPAPMKQMLDLISLLYHVDVTVVNSSHELEDIAARYRLHPIQRLLSAVTLLHLIDRMQETQIYVTTDALMMHLIILLMEGVPVIFGPFFSRLFTQGDARAVLEQYEIRDLPEKTLQHYISSFPLLSEKEATHVITCLLQQCCPQEPPRTIVHIDYREKQKMEDPDRQREKRMDHTRLIEQRYDYEQSFMHSVAEGNARQAIQDLHRMRRDVAYLKEPGTTLEFERVAAAITRTTMRHAVFQAGLPSVIVDQISNESTALIHRTNNVDVIERATEKLVRDFCTAMRQFKNKQHTALVQSALYYLEREYANDLMIQSLAEELDVSVNHLISAFKQEVGTTPNAYLRQIRLKEAARLLTATDISVQKIAAEVGIPDANYFIKLFRSEYGETPAAYRKKYRV